MKMNTQINVSVPQHWKTDLEKLARLLSVKEDKTLTHLDLMRRAIQKQYGLKEDESTDLIDTQSNKGVSSL